MTNKEKQLLEKYQKLNYTEMFNDFMPISLNDFSEDFIEILEFMFVSKFEEEDPKLYMNESYYEEPKGLSFEEALEIKYNSLTDSDKELWDRSEFL